MLMMQAPLASFGAVRWGNRRASDVHSEIGCGGGQSHRLVGCGGAVWALDSRGGSFRRLVCAKMIGPTWSLEGVQRRIFRHQEVGRPITRKIRPLPAWANFEAVGMRGERDGK